MSRILRFEIKRAIHGKELFMSLLIGCSMVVLDICLYYKLFYGNPQFDNALAAWIGTNYRFVYNTMFYVLFPILVALPFAGSYYTDLKRGYIKNICLKVSRQEYFKAKYISVFISAAMAVMIPLLLSLFLSMGLFPMRKPDKLLFLTAGIIDMHLFPRIFNLYPLMYCVIFILIDGMFAGMLAVYCICIAEHVESLFSALSVPFSIYVLLGVLFSGTSTNTWSLMQMLNPLQTYVVYDWQVVAYFAGGMFISIIWICMKGRRKDIL